MLTITYSVPSALLHAQARPSSSVDLYRQRYVMRHMPACLSCSTSPSRQGRVSTRVISDTCLLTRPTAQLLPTESPAQATIVHSFAGASAGAIATMATHPFDVVKVCATVTSRYALSHTVFPDKNASPYRTTISRTHADCFHSVEGTWAVPQDVL